ncbi:hypothetical protein SAMN05444123_101219 [Rhodopseudomonas pseudopalustris]|uniref:Uncharacterized protein n=1 Tax=Rhodopseudomonas pseudopalustris TaxID=1513892 RepID=A0A1H8LTN3_9BRAD|nr:hypothetical protein SAMN05444123_101219 [Rhodopseudomonas pseudopalustris]
MGSASGDTGDQGTSVGAGSRRSTPIRTSTERRLSGWRSGPCGTHQSSRPIRSTQSRWTHLVRTTKRRWPVTSAAGSARRHRRPGWPSRTPGGFTRIGGFWRRGDGGGRLDRSSLRSIGCRSPRCACRPTSSTNCVAWVSIGCVTCLGRRERLGVTLRPHSRAAPRPGDWHDFGADRSDQAGGDDRGPATFVEPIGAAETIAR